MTLSGDFQFLKEKNCWKIYGKKTGNCELFYIPGRKITELLFWEYPG